MLTSLDLPDDLMRRAKIAAVELGTTLRELVGIALERELSASRPASPTPPRRAKFPIFRSAKPGKLKLTNLDINALEAEDDRRRHGRAR